MNSDAERHPPAAVFVTPTDRNAASATFAMAALAKLFRKHSRSYEVRDIEHELCG